MLLRSIILLLATSSSLRTVVYNSTAFGGVIISNTSGVPPSTSDGLVAVGCNQSAEIVGRLRTNVTALAPGPLTAELRFSAEIDEHATAVRVWVADFLVIDYDHHSTHGVVSTAGDAGKATTEVAGILALPHRVWSSAAPPMIRVQFARQCIYESSSVSITTEGQLRLLWGRGAVGATTLTEVPSAAMLPSLSAAQLAREAMRHRLYAPVVPWQTYAHSSMTAHTLQPTGLVLRLGLAFNGSERLGDARGGILAWHRFLPAHVLPGRHSLNGSDYTHLSVQNWGAATGGGAVPMSRRNATFKIETTTLTAKGKPCTGGWAEPCDLLARIACRGEDCKSMAATLSGTFEWGRSGDVELAGTTDLLFLAPGFRDVRAFTATGCSGLVASASAGLGGGSSAPLRLIHFGDDVSGGVVAVSTGRRRSVSDIGSAVSAARTRANVLPAHLGSTAVAELARPMFDVLAWNTLFTNSLHVYTPVSRTFGASNNDDASTTFVWDVFFAAVMFGAAGPKGSLRARDLAYANVITTVMSRTTTGMVPNYRNGQGGKSCTYDRTEPMVGTWSLEILHSVYKDDWIAALLWEPLLQWNLWIWERRTAEGVLGHGRPGGKTALISLGSDGPPLVPEGLNTPHTLSAARYESGLDNSPQYDGPKGGNEGYGEGPVRYNNVTMHMELYDVAFTSYHARDGRALLALAGAAGVNGDVVANLATRVAATEAALHRDLYDARTGQYSNRLYNGTFYRRWAPTVFAPMLLNSTFPERVNAMVKMMGNRSTFCVAYNNASLTYLWRMEAGSGGFLARGQSITCASQACLQSTVLSVADFVGIEVNIFNSCQYSHDFTLRL